MNSSANQLLLMRILLILLVSFFCLDKSTGQQLSYEQLMEELDQLTYEQAVSRLTRYQAQNPFNANTYLQLGFLCEQIYKDLDPLRETREIQYWVNNALLFYPLFSVFLESGELRRNREYYNNIPISYSGRRLETSDVLAFIDERIHFCNNYLENVTEIYTTLERSKDHYNNCVRIFNDINERYENLSEVLLQTDDQFLELLNELEEEYNSSIREFLQYRTLLRSFPIEGYNQRYTLRPISTFRLDGLTNSDFLQEHFYLWDYGSWVRQFRNTYEEDILSLRNEIEYLQQQFDLNKRIVLSKDIALSELHLDTYDAQFFYRLGIYDNNSLVRELFRYLNARQEYLLMSRNPLSSPDDRLAVLMNRKLRYYYRLALQLNQTDNRLYEFGEAIDARRVARFNCFFNEYYGGKDGLLVFQKKEHVFLNDIFSERMGYLKQYFENERALRYSLGNTPVRQGVFVPLTPVDPTVRPIQGLDYVTLDVQYDQGDPVYVAGYKKQQNGKQMPIVTKISEELSIEWMRELPGVVTNLAEAGGAVQKIFPFGDGVMALTTSAYTQEVFVQDEFGINYDQTVRRRFYHNNLVKLDATGKVVFQKPLEDRRKPIYLKYDDINMVSILAFGQEVPDNPGVYADISISKTDSTGTTLWSTTLDIKGALVDVVRTEDHYLAFFNFHEYHIAGEHKISGNQGKNTALLIATISPSGTPVNTTAILDQESFYIDRLFNISSDEINLLGYSGLPGNRTGDLKYFIVSSTSELLFKNF